MASEVYDPRERVREVLEANGFGWEEPERPGTIIRSRIAMGLGGRDDEINNCLRSHEFRRLLYWLSDRKSSGPLTIECLSQKTGLNEQRLREYLEVLNFHRLVNHIDGAWGMAPEVDAAAFGPTLEWYVARRFNADLHWQATWGVHLKDFAYNDFDVVAIRGQNIVVVECKLTGPDNIEDSHIEAFFERHSFLAPDFSLFLVDTNTSTRTLATRINDYVLKRIGPAGQPISPLELDPGGNAFSTVQFIYVANTNAGCTDRLLRSLQLCLRHHHSCRRVATWG